MEWLLWPVDSYKLWKQRKLPSHFSLLANKLFNRISWWRMYYQRADAHEGQRPRDSCSSWPMSLTARASWSLAIEHWNEGKPQPHNSPLNQSQEFREEREAVQVTDWSSKAKVIKVKKDFGNCLCRGVPPLSLNGFRISIVVARPLTVNALASEFGSLHSW